MGRYFLKKMAEVAGNPIRRYLAVFVIVCIAVLLATHSVHAAGTPSGTVVSATATADYEVGGISQTQISSAETTFIVDTRVDLTVSESSSGYTSVTPGAVSQVLTFTVTNTGNATQDFELSAAAGNDPFGGTDNFDATAVQVFADANSNGTYESATDTATFVDELAADAAVTVFVVASIPIAQTDGDIAAYTLTATAHDSGAAGSLGALTAETAGANTSGVDVVFADGAGDTDAAQDGSHSDTDAYQVVSAALSISKTVAVISDPINGATNPKIIPGAVLEYTITVSNANGAGASATAIQVTSDLSTEIVTNGSIAFYADGYGAGTGIQVTAPNINGGATIALTNAADADEGSFASNQVTVTGIALNANEQALVLFRVQVVYP